MARLPFSNENVEEMFQKYVCCWTPFEEFKSKYWCRVHSKHCDGGCRWHFAFFKNANVFSQMLMSWHPSAKHLQIFCKHPKGLIMHILNAILQYSIVLLEQLLLAPPPAQPFERTGHAVCSSRLQYFHSGRVYKWNWSVWLCVSVITSNMIIISARRPHRPL